MSPRRYDQRLRAEAAEETRRRILDALYERLKAEPSRPVSVDEIAQIARVARSTIYLIFGSRAGLFDALAAELFRSGEFALVEAAAANPDARESLRDGFLRRRADVRGTPRRLPRAQLDGPARRERRGRGGSAARCRPGGRHGPAGGAARRGRPAARRISEEDAAHVLWLLTSFDSFDLLYTGRGLPLDDVVEVLTTTAERSLYR